MWVSSRVQAWEPTITQQEVKVGQKEWWRDWSLCTMIRHSFQCLNLKGDPEAWDMLQWHPRKLRYGRSKIQQWLFHEADYEEDNSSLYHTVFSVCLKFSTIKYLRTENFDVRQCRTLVIANTHFKRLSLESLNSPRPWSQTHWMVKGWSLLLNSANNLKQPQEQ